MKRFRLLLLSAALFCGPVLAKETVVAQDAWVREAPPGAQVMAGYMKLVNSSEHVESVVSASAEGFARVELHETVLEKGSAMMREVKALRVPARGELALAPGGFHLMLMQPRRPFRAGDEVAIVLKLQNGDVLRIHAPVRAGHTPTHQH